MSQPLAELSSAARESQVVAAPPPRQSHVTMAYPAWLRVETFGHSDIGLVREGNEDSFAVLPDLGLFMVADGMGGAAAGEVASRMVLDCVCKAFEDGEMTWPMAAGEENRTLGASLLNAGLQRAHTRIRGLASCERDKAGMGTTFAAVLALADRVVVAHVGDSRVYRLRGRLLDLLTEDHSLLNEFIRAGLWNPDEADSFPHRNVITRAVGGHGADALEVEMRIDLPQPGDVYLICSDGLHGMVSGQEIASVLLTHRDLTQATTRLIELANDHGGEDNITAVLVRITAVGTP